MPSPRRVNPYRLDPRKEKREENLTFVDKFKAAFKPTEEREQYLDQQAEANRRKKEEEERALRETKRKKSSLL